MCGVFTVINVWEHLLVHRDDAVGVTRLVGTAVADLARNILNYSSFFRSMSSGASYRLSSSVYCDFERIPKHTGPQVALPRAAPDVVIALHHLRHKLQTTSLWHDRWDGWTLPPFLQTPECALSSNDLLKKTPKGNNEDKEKGGFRTRPVVRRAVGTTKAHAAAHHIAISPRHSVRIPPVPPARPILNVGVTSEAVSAFGTFSSV